jgi:DNA polymerase
MPSLHVDFETRSAVDLKKAGVYRYAEDPSTDIWCLCWAIDDGPVQVWLPGDPVPLEFHHAVDAGEGYYEFVAHNAAFERNIWSRILRPRYGFPVPHLRQWRCTMAQAMALALPGDLGTLSRVLGTTTQKDDAGHRLMLQMMKPRKTEGDVHTWWDDADRKARLIGYCVTDVETERLCDKKLFKLRPAEQELWFLDQTINDRGIGVDLDLCNRAMSAIEYTTNQLNLAMNRLTGGTVVGDRVVVSGEVRGITNVAQMIDYCLDRGIPVPKGGKNDAYSLAKDKITLLLERGDLPDDVVEMLQLRQEGAKASVAKVKALMQGRSMNGRAQGLLQYHAASTGRWAGRRFQPQNIKRPEKKGEVSQAIDIMLKADPAQIGPTMEMLYDRPLSTVSDCIRGMVIAAPGKRIIARDFSNIEGRMLAWLAAEERKLDAFRAYDAGTGADIYKITAADILGLRPSDIDEDQRQAYGKVPELALGYQGGVGAFQSMAKIYGVKLTNAQADAIKVGWREKNPNIKEFWHDLEWSIKEALYTGKAIQCGKLLFKKVGDFMFMRLPSGRSLAYAFPTVRDKEMPWIDEKTGKKAIKKTFSYMGINSYTRQWERCYAYGGLLAENATSGAARDVMAEAMVRVEAAGYETILTVHDEIVCENYAYEIDEPEFDRLVNTLPPWATGLPIAAGGFTAERYRK